MNEEFQKYTEMAQAYLAKKERKNYYVTKGMCEPYPDYNDYLAELTDDEVNQIRALKEQYGNDFTSHLNEVIGDEDVIHDMFYGEPADIDLDDLRHQYTFTIREVSEDRVAMIRKVLVELTDDEYIKLRYPVDYYDATPGTVEVSDKELESLRNPAYEQLM